MSESNLNTQLLAQNLRTLGMERIAEGRAQDVLFGAAAQISAASNLDRPELRIAIYPIHAEGDEDWAQGFTLLLAAILEEIADCQTFRIFQPDVHLPTLGETARLTGSLIASDDQFILQLRAQIPFGTKEHLWETPPADLPDLVTSLTNLARRIVNDLQANIPLEQDFDLPESIANDPTTCECFRKCWGFERDFCLALAGVEWPASSIQAHLERLLAIAGYRENPLARWLAQYCLVRSLLPGAPSAEMASALLPKILPHFPSDGIFAARVLQNLALGGAPAAAIQLLEELTTEAKPPAIFLHTLAQQHARAYRFADACQVYQVALLAGGDPADLALDYARLLCQLVESEQAIDQLPLTASDDDTFDTLAVLQEAIEAYEQELRARPQNYTAKYEQMILLLEIDPPRFWKGFGELVTHPAAIEELRLLIGELESYDGDLERGQQLLGAACEGAPERIDLRCAYAEYLLLLNEHRAAVIDLQEIHSQAQDGNRENLIEIERLLLIARGEEFELRLGEISASMRGGTIRENELEFLENALDAAPHQLHLYLMLAAGYQLGGDPISALEVLLDAREQLGDEAALLHHLSIVTWQLNEHDVALRYLSEGLRQHPLNIPILTQLARCHLSLGEDTAAKEFIVRAESLAAEHPSLLQLQAYIAREMRQ